MPKDRKSSRIFHDAGRTIFQLVIVSIIVGAIFSFVRISPRDFWHGIFETFRRIISALGNSLTEVLGTLGTYLFIGAAIVVPLWFISRLWAGRK